MPNRLVVDRDTKGRLYYQYTTSTEDAPTMKGVTVNLPPSDVLHIPGLGFDEVGEKGAYLGEVGENGLSLSFVKLCGSMTLERTLNVTGCRSLTEVALLYDRTIGPLRGHRLLLTLTGSPSGFAVDAQALARLLADRAAKIRIEDETRPELDLSAAAREDTLRGAFVRQMQRRIDQAQADGGDARTELLALELGLSAFEGEVTGDAD